MTRIITLSGDGLTPARLARIAGGAAVSLAPEGLARMAASRAHLMAAIARDEPMYGITTGLGQRVTERLDADAQVEMSLNTIRGRAHAVGAPLPAATVRAAMAVRANTLLIGASGADPALARLLGECLNAGLTPVVRETGSIGAADLMWGGQLGLGMIGEGRMDTPNGPLAASRALGDAGLSPYRPGPREGLALVSHSSFVGAIAALGADRLRNAYLTAQTAAALSLEGFQANLTPLDPRVLAMRPQPGQAESARDLLARLSGSSLTTRGAARRVQDPLSLRNVAQVHGTVFAALQSLDEAATREINGASDNPVVLVDGSVLSSGGFLSAHLTITLCAAAQAATHLAAAQTARMAKHLNNRFSDLPAGLTARHASSAGYAPVMKTAEALFAKIAHLAQPSLVYPGASADGVEDIVANSAIPAAALLSLVPCLDRLNAIELMISAQAVETRGTVPVPPALAAAIAALRRRVAPLTTDRALGEDIETLAVIGASGHFANPSPIAPPEGAGGAR